MRTVRWAQAALLAVVLPACAHGGSNENPDTTANKAQQSADHTVVAQGGEAKTFRQRLRPVFLAANNVADVNTTYALRQEVVADAPSCDPWTPQKTEGCDLSEMVTNIVR